MLPGCEGKTGQRVVGSPVGPLACLTVNFGLIRREEGDLLLASARFGLRWGLLPQPGHAHAVCGKGRSPGCEGNMGMFPMS